MNKMISEETELEKVLRNTLREFNIKIKEIEDKHNIQIKLAIREESIPERNRHEWIVELG